jgi:hypothetical protein
VCLFIHSDWRTEKAIVEWSAYGNGLMKINGSVISIQIGYVRYNICCQRRPLALFPRAAKGVNLYQCFDVDYFVRGKKSR